MFPTVRSHQEYQDFVMQQLKLYYVDGPLTLQDDDWILIKKLWLVDLSHTFSLLKDTFSKQGPCPHDPADLLRSYLLMHLTRTFSVTKWITELRRIPLFAVLSGFPPGKTPGIGTFYDFFSRLWLTDSPNFRSKLKRKPKKVEKGKHKGDKAPTTSPGKVALVVKGLDLAPSRQKLFPFDRIFTLFKELFVMHSASLGILGDVNSLCLAGDGTPVRTAAYPRNKRICDCKQKGIPHCDCLRIYSQPDCNSGWDSYRQAYFYGYHLYSFSSTASKYDLPIYCRLHPASRHDSISMLLTAEEFRYRYPEWSWGKVLLDSAHDAMPIYRFFDKRKVIPLIDLNKRNLGKSTFKDDFSLSETGVPICKKGLEMKDNGYDYSRCRRKYRCPLVKKGKVTCDSPCSPSPYGRCIYTYTEHNPRLFPLIARYSNEWKNSYKRRTCSERSNKRGKIDYMLEAARHRSSKLWTVHIFAIMMCMHLDAWFKENKNLNLKDSLLAA